MKTRMWLSALLVAALMAGCRARMQTQEPEPAPGPVSADVIERLKQRSPDAIFAQVTAVAENERRLTLGDVSAGALKPNDVVTVFGGDAIVANGTVISVSDGSAQVQYTPTATAARAPAVGDLAVRFTR
jgi:hypothetical protein